jgi:hypothetical protein
MPEAHHIMSENPDLGSSIQNAIHQVDKTNKTEHYMAPLNHEMFYQSQEGQEDDLSDDDQPMELNFQKSTKNSRSRSRSESRSRSRSRSESPKKDDASENSQASDTESEGKGDDPYPSDQEDL